MCGVALLEMAKCYLLIVNCKLFRTFAENKNTLSVFKMKILYLHGLDSTLQDDRRTVLALYGQIFAPEVDYRNSPNLLEALASEYADIDAIIGSSAGGLVGYYLAQKEVPTEVQPNRYYAAYMQVVIGLQDAVIDPWQSLDALKNNLQLHQPAEIHLINNMAHSYPITIFEQEVRKFFHKITLNK